MQFESSIELLINNQDSGNIGIFASLQFPGEVIRVHTGIGDRPFDGETYKGIGSFASIGTVEHKGKVQSNRLKVGLEFTDPAQVSTLINLDPTGGDATVYLVKFDQDKQVLGGAVLFAGYIAETGIRKGTPYQVTLTLADWMEAWARPVENAKITDASQQAKYPGDQIYDQVETLAKGLDDTVPGETIAGGGDRGGTPPPQDER